MSTLTVILIVAGVVEAIGLLWLVGMARSAALADAVLAEGREQPAPPVSGRAVEPADANVTPIVRVRARRRQTA
jgi:hypothetical protein